MKFIWNDMNIFVSDVIQFFFQITISTNQFNFFFLLAELVTTLFNGSHQHSMYISVHAIKKKKKAFLMENSSV